MKTLISLYPDIWQTIDAKEVPLDTFIENIKCGTWQDIVIPIRAEKDKKKRQEMKKKLPCVTVSGTFADRKDGTIRAHSGYIAIDLDDLNSEVEGVRRLLAKDPYVYTAFTSVSGMGLCVIMQIEGDKHREAFEGIAKYLYDSYQLIVDQSGKNESRVRYCSYDPNLDINERCIKFKKYLPKEKERKIPKTVYVQSDFDEIIKQFHDRNINICDNYHDWVMVGYAIASKFGERGFDYFDTLSRMSGKYDSESCSRQYAVICKNISESKDKQATIATIYYFAKQNGIPFYSEQTKRILGCTTVLKKSGMAEKAVIESLAKFENIPAEESTDIVIEAFKSGVELHGEDSIITSIEQYLRYNHSLRRNCITRRIENFNKPMQMADFNTIFLAIKKLYPDVNYDLFERIVLSDNTNDFNPLMDFFNSYIERTPTGVIDELWSCFNTTDNQHLAYFGKKWLVGLISAIHGTHSPLMLILCGEVQNTGKTEAFRRMLPDELRAYYAESKLDAGKDDEILMTQKILIVDDEMGGKSKAESKRLKDLTSKQTFSLREPYGRNNVDLNRMAVLGGTTNDLAVLNDPTGNRRLLPSEIISINHAKYNSIDKIDLIMEAYHLYKAGFGWQLTKQDIERLNSSTAQFEDHSLERELLQKYLLMPQHFPNHIAQEMTATDVKIYIELRSNQRMQLKKIGTELKSIGYESKHKKINGKTQQIYLVIAENVGEHSNVSNNPYTIGENPPF